MDMPAPRYRSIFWPLVLVAAGVLWLLKSLGQLPELNFWVLLRLWPLLLIGLGLDLLVGRRWPWASAAIAILMVGAAVLALLFARPLGLDSPAWTLPGGRLGSGRIVTESREVSGFTALTFESYGDLEITQGQTESLTIESDDDVLPQIRTRVSNGTLYIEAVPGQSWLQRVRPTRGITYRLVVTDLERLNLSGAGNARITGLKTSGLHVTLSGAGNVRVDDLTAGEASFGLSGAGNFEANGQVERQTVRVSGLGSFKGEALESQQAEVNISGAGSATVWATETLDVTISGLGSVRYYGSPSVDRSISGGGSVQQLGEK